MMMILAPYLSISLYIADIFILCSVLCVLYKNKFTKLNVLALRVINILFIFLFFYCVYEMICAIANIKKINGQYDLRPCHRAHGGRSLSLCAFFFSLHHRTTITYYVYILLLQASLEHFFFLFFKCMYALRAFYIATDAADVCSSHESLFLFCLKLCM